MTLFTLLATPVRIVAQGEQPQAVHFQHYTVTDLGTLGGTYSYGYGINNVGVVSGGAATPTQTGGVSQTAFLWHGGHMINLGTLGGRNCPACNSEAGGPNASSESPLVSETSTTDPNGEDFCGFGTHLQCLGAIWKNGVMTALPNLPGGHNGQAYWVNNQGQVVGLAENDIADSTCSVPFQAFRYEAVMWRPNGKIQELRPLPGDTVGFAFGINNKGLSVGSSGLCSNVSLPPNSPPNGPHAVLWNEDGSPTDLGNLEGAPFNIATSINDLGEVVGNSQFTDGTVQAFLWTKATGKPQGLGTLPGDFLSVAPCCNTINNRGQVVGFSIPGPQGSGRAFIWQNGVMADLNTLIPAGSPWYLLAACSINDAGQIAGQGLINGNVHAFLLTPR
jgi:probable HAF family extracellular repeat protein